MKTTTRAGDARPGSWEKEDLRCRDLPTLPQPDSGRILVAGASGYVGGRLVPELLARGYRVRVMVRAASPEYVELWPGAEIAVADALDGESLRDALRGIHTAYYLIHSLLLGNERFESADHRAAANFREAAEENDVKRMIYLGGLGDSRTSLSSHLRSRMRVADELGGGSIPTTVLRAAVIVGSGSASYEILKHLVLHLPVLLMPKWSRTKCQPIAVRDVIKYLVGVLETPETAGESFDIGGPEVMTYGQMIRVLADCLGKRRLFLPSAVSNIGVFAYLASLATPVPAPITKCLFGSLGHEVVCENDDIRSFVRFPTIPYREAILRAMTREEQDRVYTRWSDAYPPAHELAVKLHELEEPVQYSSSYSLLTRKEPARLFRSICQIGGREGWFRSNLLWRIRGAIDRILFGVGISRGRRSASRLRINDVIDFWRVEDMRQDEMLLLRAEMKLPGRAWLQFRIDALHSGKRLSIKAYYQTWSFFGKAYWFLFLPFHVFIFQDLIRQIEKRS